MFCFYFASAQALVFGECFAVEFLSKSYCDCSLKETATEEGQRPGVSDGG